jgi:8-oxo-dGTP pyrophosphatase MutT (NUDIX family)
MAAGPQLRQVGALPWRRRANGLSVLLATSRETRRWVIPKGWAMEGMTDHGAAAQEAHEEAGVEGIVAPTAIGTFDYDKRRKDGALLRIRVDVYGLEVLKERRAWPEKSERSRLWFSPAEAALLVKEQGLAELIMAFARGMA